MTTWWSSATACGGGCSAGRPDVLGSTLQLNGEPYQVIGVMPPSFHDFYMRQTDVWAPLAFKPEQFADDKRTNEFLRMTGTA